MFVCQLNDSKSFYGYCTTPDHKIKVSTHGRAFSTTIELNHETLYSLIISILPALTHNYQVMAIEEGNLNEISDNTDSTHKKCLTILITTLNALRKSGGWNIPKVTDSQNYKLYSH